MRRKTQKGEIQLEVQDDRKFVFDLYRALRKLCLDLSLVPNRMVDWARAPAPQATGLDHAELPFSSDASIDTVHTDETRDPGNTDVIEENISPIARPGSNTQDKESQALKDGVKFDKVVELVRVTSAQSYRVPAHIAACIAPASPQRFLVSHVSRSFMTHGCIHLTAMYVQSVQLFGC